MKLLIVILLVIAVIPMNASEEKWAAIRKANAETEKTYDKLWKKAGFEERDGDWSVKQLKKRLQTWEYHFILASMFDGVANNGGLIHGLHCFFDESEESELYVPWEDMVACWKATGCNYLIKAHEIGQRELKKFGVSNYEDLTGEQEDQLEEILDDAWVSDGNPFEVRLAAYCKRNQGPDSRLKRNSD